MAENVALVLDVVRQDFSFRRSGHREADLSVNSGGAMRMATRYTRAGVVFKKAALRDARPALRAALRSTVPAQGAPALMRSLLATQR